MPPVCVREFHAGFRNIVVRAPQALVGSRECRLQCGQAIRLLIDCLAPRSLAEADRQKCEEESLNAWIAFVHTALLAVSISPYFLTLRDGIPPMAAWTLASP